MFVTQELQAKKGCTDWLCPGPAQSSDQSLGKCTLWCSVTLRVPLGKSAWVLVSGAVIMESPAQMPQLIPQCNETFSSNDSFNTGSSFFWDGVLKKNNK